MSRLISLVASAARTTSSQSTGVLAADDSKRLHVVCVASAKTGTNPTLDLDLQSSLDNTNWVTVKSFSQLTDTGNAAITVAKSEDATTGVSWGPYLRIKWTIGGTNTPGYTFKVDAWEDVE